MADGLSLTDRIELLQGVLTQSETKSFPFLERFRIVGSEELDEDYLKLEDAGFTEAKDSVLIELLPALEKSRPTLAGVIKNVLSERLSQIYEGNEPPGADFSITDDFDREKEILSRINRLALAVNDTETLQEVHQQAIKRGRIGMFWNDDCYENPPNIEEFTRCITEYELRKGTTSFDSNNANLIINAMPLGAETPLFEPHRAVFHSMLFRRIEDEFKKAFIPRVLEYVLESCKYSAEQSKSIEAAMYLGDENPEKKPRRLAVANKQLLKTLKETKLPLEETSGIQKTRRGLITHLLSKWEPHQLIHGENYQELTLEELLPFADVLHTETGPFSKLNAIYSLARTAMETNPRNSDVSTRVIAFLDAIGMTPAKDYFYGKRAKTLPEAERIGLVTRMLRKEKQFRTDPYFVQKRKEEGDTFHPVPNVFFYSENLPAYSDSDDDCGFRSALIKADKQTRRLYKENLLKSGRADIWTIACESDPAFMELGHARASHFKKQALQLEKIDFSDLDHDWEQLSKYLSLEEILSMARRFAKIDYAIASTAAAYYEAFLRSDDKETVKREAMAWADGHLSKESLQDMLTTRKVDFMRPMKYFSMGKDSYLFPIILYNKLAPEQVPEKFKFVMETIEEQLTLLSGDHEHEFTIYRLQQHIQEIFMSVHLRQLEIPSSMKIEYAKKHGHLFPWLTASHLLEGEESTEGREVAAKLYLQAGKLEEARKIFSSLGKTEECEEAIRQSRIETVRKNLSENVQQGFTALQELVKSGEIQLNISTQEKNLTGGFFNDFVSRFDYTGQFNLSFIVKFQIDTEERRKRVALEERIYEGLRKHIRVPRRVKTDFQETSSEQKYILTVDEALPGRDLDDLPSIRKKTLVSAASLIHKIQNELEDILKDEDKTLFRDRYDDGERFAYSEKIATHLSSAFGIAVAKEVFDPINQVLNKKFYATNKTYTFDANPSNLRVADDRDFALFDFNVVRYAHRQDDWVRFIDQPGFLADDKRDEVLGFFLEERRSDYLFHRLDEATETRLFHGMAVYRNLCQASLRYVDGRTEMAEWYLHRAKMSAEALGIERVKNIIIDISKKVEGA